MGDLIHLYNLCKNNSEFCKFVSQARNEYRENLLHVACKQTNPRLIGPLIGMECRLDAQDLLGRTPLHIAISKKNDEIISAIVKRLENLKEYPETVKKGFIRMISAYDGNGYTVLHAAALEHQCSLFENLLKFCVENQMNVLDYGTLHSGDTIGHLMIKNNLTDIVPLLEKYVPNYQDAKNYEGITVKYY